LAEWLEASIDLSMPGESGELPPTPEFSRPLAAEVETPPVAESPAVAKAPPTVAAPTPPTTAKPVVEPEDRPPPSLPTKDAPAVAVAPVESKPAARVVAPPEAMERRPSDAPLTAKKPVVAAKPVAVNLAELNARIAGYHQGLAEVEAAIVAADGELDMARLTRLVEQVEQLAVQYELVRLYFDALTKRERASVTQPRSILPTIELVDRERAHLERGGESDFLAAFEVTADGKESPLAARLTAVAERMAPAEKK
jgi:hypothetical protein